MVVSHLDWRVPVVRLTLEAGAALARGQARTPDRLRSASQPSQHPHGPPEQLPAHASSPSFLSGNPLGEEEQIAEPCYLQAFKWVIES